MSAVDLLDTSDLEDFNLAYAKLGLLRHRRRLLERASLIYMAIRNLWATALS